LAHDDAQTSQRPAEKGAAYDGSVACRCLERGRGASRLGGGGSEAHAGSTTSLKSCAAALKAACGDLKPGGGRVQACFDSHFATLSEPCKSKLTQAASSARACEADVRKLCGGLAQAAEIVSCMEPRLAEVGKPCKRAMTKVVLQYSRGK
jgi:hypothetical protein